MEGSLAHRSPADVLGEIQQRQASGVLTFRRDRISRQIHVDAGVRIRFAASNHPAESLTAWFLERGGVAEEQLRRAALEKRTEEFLGSTLARLGLIAPSDLIELTEMYIRRIARAALRMGDGTCLFQEGALPLQDQTANVLTAEVLLEWTRDLNDTEWISRRLGSLDSRIQRHPRPPEGYQRIRLDPVEGYIMSRVDGVATIREICMVSPMGDDKTLSALFGLALAGILEMPALAGELAAPADRTGPPAPPLSGPARPAAQETRRTPGRPAGPGPANAPRGAPAQQPSVAGTSEPTPAAGAPGPQRPASGRPATAVRPGPIGLAPGPRVPPGRAGGAPGSTRRTAASASPYPRSAFAASSPRAASAPPSPRAADRPAVESAADIEAEMLRRFRDIHLLDLYQVLDVAPTATTDQVRRSYYALARRLHPDTFRRDELKTKAEQVFGRITEAYSTLSNQASREKYDEERLARSSHQKDDRASDATALARMNFRHGRDHFERGRLSEAVSFLQNACQQDPARSEYFEYLGLAQSRNPRFRKQAEGNLLKAIQLAPTSASAHAHLGQLYERTGALDKARDMYRKALEWDPANEIALKGLETEGTARRGILGLFSRK